MSCHFKHRRKLLAKRYLYNIIYDYSALKATAGGGGRGMCLAKEPKEFVKLIQVCLIVIRQ